MQNIWDELLRSALLGTERVPLPAHLHAVLAGAGAAPGSDDPARQLLEALAGAHLLKKAASGFDAIPPPTPAPEETAPILSMQTWRYLKQAMSPRYALVLPELLALTRKTGGVLSPECLPELLEYFQRGSYSAPFIHLLGARGHWLMQQNPQWQQLLGETPEIHWATAGFAQRMALLQQLRRTGNPEALHLLESTWQEDSAQHKQMLLLLLFEGASAADIPFLERVATDKNKDVRLRGLELLMRLAPNRRLQELSDFFRSRLAGFLHAADSQVYLEENIPDFSGEVLEYLQEWVVAQKAKRSALLELLLGLLPPGILEETSGWPPERIIPYLDDSHDKSKYLFPLIEAACLHNDRRWMRAIVAYFATQSEHNGWKEPALIKLLITLPSDLWEETFSLLAPLDALWNDESNALQKALTRHDNPWSTEMLHTVMTQVERLLRSEANVSSRWLRTILENAAVKAPPEAILALRDPLSAAVPSYHPFRRDFDWLWEIAELRKMFNVQCSIGQCTTGN